MSEPTERDQTSPTPEPTAGQPVAGVDGTDQAPVPSADESTVGTGSVVAIGCVVAMLLILILGVLLVLWTR